MTDIGVDVFAEWRVVHERMSFRCLFFRLQMARTVECSGIRSRRVLFSMEGQLGRTMLCPMKGPG